MLQAIQDIFHEISNVFQSIFGGIKDFIDGIVQIFRYIGSALSFVWTAINLIPVHYQIFSAIIISVLIIYVIVGRNAGGE